MSLVQDVETAPRFRMPEGEAEARGVAVPLVLGPLRGSWWQLGSGGKLARLLLGTYEVEQAELFQTHVRPGQTVLDVGASVGYYTLLAAGLVGKGGRVLAFEPDLTNLKYLRAHVRQNGLSQVSIFPLAVAEGYGVARFGRGTGSGTARLCADGCHDVPTASLDGLVAEHGFRPDHVKIDVEGAEVAVLRGGEQMFRKFLPTIFLSTHGGRARNTRRPCCQLLRAWGYRVEPVGTADFDSCNTFLCTAPGRTC